MEICINDYVRTDKGYIFKIDEEKKNLQMLKFLDVEYGNIVKHSNNIIDLIEIGDILRVFDNLSETEEKVNIFDDEMLKAVKEDIKDNNYKILSILTHEQFSSLEYII